MFKPLRFVASLILLFCGVAASKAATSDSIDWQTNHAAALDLAKQSGKPILIDLWATWCPPCKEMDKEVWPDSNVVALSKKFVCISIDVDKDPGSASIYRSRVIPTIIFADSWGNVINRHEGYMHASTMSRIMKGFPTDFSEINEWNGVLKRDSKNFIALFRIAEFYRKLGVLDLSNRYYKDALNTKEARSDGNLRENVLIAMGINQFKLGEFDNARKTLQKCLKEVPNGSQCDKAMLGLVAVEIKRGKMADAEKVYEELKTKYPDSEATEQARRNLEQAKSQKQ